MAKLNAEDIRLYISVKKEDVGKNVQIKAKNIENIEIAKISNDIVQAIGK